MALIHMVPLVSAGAVRPAVPAVATSVAALKNNVEAGRTESISSDQLVPDYGANGARAVMRPYWCCATMNNCCRHCTSLYLL